MSSPTYRASHTISSRQYKLLIAAAGMTFLLVTMGAIVCATESGYGCPDWPGCYGNLIPPARTDAIIEYSHRISVVLTTPLIVAAAFIGWRNSRSHPWISRPPIAALILLPVVAGLGALTVLRGLSPALAAIDLGSALLILALMLAAATAAFVQRANLSASLQFSIRSPLKIISLTTLVLGFLVFVSAVLVAEGGSFVRCLGWPIYGGKHTLTEYRIWLQPLRNILSVGAAIALGATVLQARRTEQNPAIRKSATLLGFIFLLELILGFAMLLTGSSAVWMAVLYVILASLFWSLMVVQSTLTVLTNNNI
jgi:heme a synthase